ncbi:MAG: Hsp20 family protein [Methyloligellaceae bacterium]
MSHFDLSPLYRSTVGFDRMFSLIDSLAGPNENQSGFPPYDIVQQDENAYRISIALAGFSNDELNIQVEENTLTIRGEKLSDVENESTRTLHRGIAARNFQRTFQLADHVEVKNAALENGLLHIDLIREIPEAMKPRNIEIKSSDTKQLLKSEAA